MNRKRPFLQQREVAEQADQDRKRIIAKSGNKDPFYCPRWTRRNLAHALPPQTPVTLFHVLRPITDARLVEWSNHFETALLSFTTEGRRVVKPFAVSGLVGERPVTFYKKGRFKWHMEHDYQLAIVRHLLEEVISCRDIVALVQGFIELGENDECVTELYEVVERDGNKRRCF